MRLPRHLFAALLLGIGAGMPAYGAGPGGLPDTALQTPLCDPCLPPALQGLRAAPQTEGAALQAQVERKLRESFDAADQRKRGTLTREQARAAGLGVVANNFDRIDAAGRGVVTFADVQRFLRERGSKF